MSQQQQAQASGLEALIHKFAVCVALIGSFYAAPWIAQQLRTDMEDYLYQHLSSMLAYWGSWLFIGIVILAAFFGSAALLQLIINLIIQSLRRRDPY